MEPTRRTLRRLRQILGGEVDVAATSFDRGQGVGVRIDPPGIGIVRQPGDQGLVFGFEELAGIELIGNGDVRARAFVGEPRTPLDQRRLRLDQASVRLVFEDVRHPEFELVLIEPTDPPSRQEAGFGSALRLYAHLETIIRKNATPPPPRPSTPVEG